MVEMTLRQIIPAVTEYSRFLAETLCRLKDTGLTLDVTLEAGLLKDVSAASAALRLALGKLEKLLEKGAAMEDGYEKARFFQEKLLPAMEALRAPADRLETMLGKEYWPMPTYTDLLYGIL